MKQSRVIALLSALFLLVTGAGIAHADQIRGDSDALEAKLQSGNPATVSLTPGQSHTFNLAVHVIKNGNTHVSFPVGIRISKNDGSGILSTPSPTSGNVTAYDSAGQLPVDVTATAPQAASLTCGVTNTLTAKVIFEATTDTAELGTNGTNAEIVLKIAVDGAPCAVADTTGPTINWNPPSTDPWYASAPSASWTCSDPESGATGDGTATAGSDGKLTATCTNGTGITTSDTKTYKIDGTPPTINWTAPSTEPWYATAPSASWTCTDDQSGASGAGSLTADADGKITASCTNGAGSTTSDTKTYKIDGTPPTINWTAPSTEPWYATAPSASWTCTDDQSGASGAGSLTADADGKITATCTNGAGLSTTATKTYKVDGTPPTINWTAPSESPWYKTAQTVSWTCSDLESGATGDGSVTTSGEGAALELSATCTNGAGTKTTATKTYKVDTTAPTVDLVGGPAAGAVYYFGDTIPVPTCTATDLLSGLAGPCTVSGFSTSIGNHSISASATDNAGNVGSTGASPSTYTVKAWTLSGFYRPVDMGGIINTVKNGSTVPLKFEIFKGDTEIVDVSAVTGFTANRVACDAGATEDAIEVLATGSTSLRYDSVAGQFVYNWQTPKAAGNCYKVTMTTNDGSSLTANFKLK